MKNKKLISILCLLSLTGCGMLSTDSSSSSSIANSSSIAASTSSSSVITSTTSSSSNVESTTSSSTVDEPKNFDAETLALFDSYFGFDIPYIDLEYDLFDETSTYNKACVVLCFYNATEENFQDYLDLYDVSFMYSGETEYEGDYWYFYEKRNFYVDLYYDNYSTTVPYIYVQIYDKSIADGDSGYEGTPTVDGYFTEEDAYALDYLLGFEVPCVGDYYEISYYLDETILDVIIVYNYTTAEDYETLLGELDLSFTYVGITTNSEGTEFASYTYGDFELYAGYKNTDNLDYPYILLEIYNPAYGSGVEDEPYYNAGFFEDGEFADEDKEFLNEVVGFVPPTVGSEYEIGDMRDYYDCILINYYGVDETAFESFLEELNELYTFDMTYEADGYLFYYFANNDSYIEVVYVDDEVPYIQLAIYELPSSGDDEVEDEPYYNAGFFEDGEFADEDQEFLNEEVGFVPPTVGSEYEIGDMRDYYGCIAINYYGVDQNAFDAFLIELGELYVADISYEDGGVTYYYFVNGDSYIEVVFVTDEEVPYIQLAIYNLGDSGSDEGPYYNVGFFEDGEFAVEDQEFLTSECGVVPPTAGDEYEIYDLREEYGCIALYYYGVDADEYETLLAEFESTCTYYGAEESDGYTYYYYISGDAIIEVVYDAESAYPYVQIAIY